MAGRFIAGERGAGFLVLLFMLLVLSFLSVSVLETTTEDRQMALLLHRERVMTDLAESGLEIGVSLLNRGGPIPPDATVRDSGICSLAKREDFFKRRCADSAGHPSFVNGLGSSQFGGTPLLPDFEWVIASKTLGDTTIPGANISLRISAPTLSGGIARLESDVGDSGGNRRASRAEVIQSPWPVPIPAVESWEGTSFPLPLRVHWGDTWIHGDADLGASVTAIPAKSASAPIGAEVYSPGGMEDRWMDIFVSGTIVSPSGAAGLTNVHQGEAGLHASAWSYEALKAFARSYGKIYVPDLSGFLHEPGDAAAYAPNDLLGPLYNGGGSGFVFIDTLDESPPKADGSNLGTITLTSDYMEAHLYVAGNIVLSPGAGRPLDVLSPPDPEESRDPAARIPVVLEGIHFHGAIFAEGNIVVSRPSRQFGAIAARKGIRLDSEYELWFDWDLDTGDIPGIPRLIIYPGSRRTS